METQTDTPATAFHQDVQRDLKAFVAMRTPPEKPTVADYFQGKAQLLWREMIEDEGMGELEALEILMRAVVKEAKARAQESGRWSPRELHGRAAILEEAADAMLETVAEEVRRL